MLIRCFTFMLALWCVTGSAHAADTYPSRPIRLLVGYSSGGGSDLMARMAADQLARRLGVAVVVDNVPGAAQNIAAGRVAQAAPDGYTMFMSSPALTINPWLHKDAGFSPTESFEPVALFGQSPNVLVVPAALGVKTVRELETYLKARKDTNFSSAGIGTTHHLSAELFKQLIRYDGAVHVPYKGAGEAVLAVIAGDVQFTFVSLPSAKSLIGNDKVRLLGLTGSERSRLLPGVPMLFETGLPGMEIGTWYALLLPAKTPRAVVERVNAAINAPDDDFTQKLAGVGVDRVRRTPEAFAAFIRQDLERWKALLANVKVSRE